MRRLSPDLTKIQQLQLTQYTVTENVDFSYMYISGKITIIPKPELSAFWGGFPYSTTLLGDLG